MAATVESLTVPLVDQTSTVAGQMDAAMRGAADAADFKQVLDSLQEVTGNVDALTQSFVAQQLQTQTDTLVQTLQDNNTSLLGEIAALRREIQGQTRQMAAS